MKNKTIIIKIMCDNETFSFAPYITVSNILNDLADNVYINGSILVLNKLVLKDLDGIACGSVKLIGF